MHRFMRQEVFDELVIVRAMVDLTDRDEIFDELLREHLRLYPSEHARSLVSDVNAAAKTLWELIKLIVEKRPPTTAKNEVVYLHSILVELRESMARQFGRRPGENSRRSSLFDRVKMCRRRLGLWSEPRGSSSNEQSPGGI